MRSYLLKVSRKRNIDSLYKSASTHRIAENKWKLSRLRLGAFTAQYLHSVLLTDTNRNPTLNHCKHILNVIL